MNNPITIVFTGILLNAAGLTFNFYYLNIAGGIVCLLGLKRMGLTGNSAKKAKTQAILSIPFAIISVAIGILAPQATDGAIIMLGINVFFFVYFTYYFTEALIACANDVNELAATRNFRSIWTLCGIAAFIYFMLVFSSFISTVITIMKIIFLLSALYYCSSINASAKAIFKN